MDNPIISAYTSKKQPELIKENSFPSATILITSLVLGIILGLMLFGCRQDPVWAMEIEYTNEEIANAIFKAENSKSHPYGILIKYKTTSARQACLNTIKNQRVRHANHDCGKEYLECLANRYAPVNCDNDNGTNQYWLKNVRYFLGRAK